MRTSNAVNCIIDNVWQMEVSHEEIIDLINFMVAVNAGKQFL